METKKETKDFTIKSICAQIQHKNDNTTPRQRFFLPYQEDDIYSLLGQYYKAEVLRRLTANNKYEPASDDLKRNIHLASKWLCDPNKRPGLMLYGTVGTGKSTLLFAIRDLINRVCKREQYDNGKIEDVLDAPNPITIVKAKRIVDDYQLARSRYDLMNRVALLAIDEMGVEASETRQYGNTSEPVIDLLSERYDNQLVTIVSTNMSMNEIKEKYGLRMQDRFREMFTALPFTGQSFRL